MLSGKDTGRLLIAAVMPAPALTVWYNTRCPVCDAGIDWQRNKLLSAVRAIALKGINEQPDALAANGVRER
jgi:predicted DCC family thiol-disulfide oxidoreductase YuxK